MSIFTGTVFHQTLYWLLQFSLLSVCNCHRHDTPRNTVGMFLDDIVLECNRNATHGVRWKYMAPGSSDEQSILSRHRTVSTSYGIDRLIIEDVQLSDAGRYVCESPKYPSEFQKSISYLVVLTHPPVCTSSLTEVVGNEGRMAKLTCWLHYAGAPQARLTMTWTGPQGTILKTSVFNHTDENISSATITVHVPAREPYFGPHKCQATFTTTVAYEDLASNDPVFSGGWCETPASSPTNEVAEALSSGSRNCTSTGPSPDPDVERQEGEDVGAWRTVSNLLVGAAITAVIGALVVGCIFIVRVNRIMSQVLEKCLSVCPAPTEDRVKEASESKLDSARDIDNPESEEPTSVGDSGTDAPEYRNQCTEVGPDPNTVIVDLTCPPSPSRVSHPSCLPAAADRTEISLDGRLYEGLEISIHPPGEVPDEPMGTAHGRNFLSAEEAEIPVVAVSSEGDLVMEMAEGQPGSLICLPPRSDSESSV